MAFPCPNCRHQLHLEESACPSCAHAVGYDWRIDAFRHLDPRAREWHDAEGSAAAVKPCANVHYGACNWLADETGAEALGPTRAMCRACRHNRMIPDLAVRGVLQRWRRIEEAKRAWKAREFPAVPGDDLERIEIPEIPKTVSYP